MLFCVYQKKFKARSKNHIPGFEINQAERRLVQKFQVAGDRTKTEKCQIKVV
jgi:hypothetical protein